MLTRGLTSWVHWVRLRELCWTQGRLLFVIIPPAAITVGFARHKLYSSCCSSSIPKKVILNEIGHLPKGMSRPCPVWRRGEHPWWSMGWTTSSVWVRRTPSYPSCFPCKGNKILYPPYIGQATYWRVAGAVTVLYINNVKRWFKVSEHRQGK